MSFVIHLFTLSSSTGPAGGKASGSGGSSRNGASKKFRGVVYPLSTFHKYDIQTHRARFCILWLSRPRPLWYTKLLQSPCAPADRRVPFHRLCCAPPRGVLRRTVTLRYSVSADAFQPHHRSIQHVLVQSRFLSV